MAIRERLDDGKAAMRQTVLDLKDLGGKVGTISMKVSIIVSAAVTLGVLFIGSLIRYAVAGWFD